MEVPERSVLIHRRQKLTVRWTGDGRTGIDTFDMKFFRTNGIETLTTKPSLLMIDRYEVLLLRFVQMIVSISNQFDAIVHIFK